MSGDFETKAREALNYYGELARMMRRATMDVDKQTSLHVMKQLALDGGDRARRALEQSGPDPLNAAAPDMLEALEAFIDAHEIPDALDCARALEIAEERIRTVVAKAKRKS